MFYSQCLLSTKCALGTVWVAAHCLKRLKKHQVYNTNISSSIDKILLDEVPVVTHRALAFLLLGVVKIYSQKVEYLYDDCNRVVDKINDFSGTKRKVIKTIEGMHAPRLSITRPRRLELDTFDLQILEDGNGDNERAAEDITLEDACTDETTRFHSPEKIHNKTDVLFPETSTSHTPVQDVFSPYATEKDIGSSSLNVINSESSIENLRRNDFTLDDRLDPMVLGEPEGEGDLSFGPGTEKDETDGSKTKSSGKQDKDYSDINLFEMELPESEKHQLSTEDRQASMSIDVTFPSKGPHDPVTTPELTEVKTPAIREHGTGGSSRKRKRLFDEVVVLSNEVVKQSLSDTSNLVCKRPKAPITALYVKKRHQITNLPRTFLEPLFPCNSFKLRSLFSGTKLKCTETVDKIENVKTPEKLNTPESPTRHKSPDETHVTPTPLTQTASIMENGDFETTEFDRGGFTSTFERIEEEEQSLIGEEEETERCLNNEDINSQGVNQESDGWSDRTRAIAMQLSRSFPSRKKRGQNNGVSLSQTLKKKSKSESAVFFYETLVLITRGYIDVEQNEAYGDILMLETPKLKQAYETGKLNVC